jgi:hypothetical protein
MVTDEKEFETGLYFVTSKIDWLNADMLVSIVWAKILSENLMVICGLTEELPCKAAGVTELTVMGKTLYRQEIGCESDNAVSALNAVKKVAVSDIMRECSVQKIVSRQ